MFEFPLSSLPDDPEPVASGIIRTRSFGTFKHEFQLEDAVSFIKDGLMLV